MGSFFFSGPLFLPPKQQRNHQQQKIIHPTFSFFPALYLFGVVGNIILTPLSSSDSLLPLLAVLPCTQSQ